MGLRVLALGLLPVWALAAACASGNSGAPPKSPTTIQQPDSGSVSGSTTIATGPNSDERTYRISNLSTSFDIEMAATGCEEGQRLVCDGALDVRLFHKTSAEPIQEIHLPATYLTLGDDGLPETDYDGLYGSHVPVILFRDVDFDGSDDLVIRNGNRGNYGGPSYDVFLALPDGTFQTSDAFTELASTGLDFPILDPEDRTLTVLTKDGCCVHFTTVYEVRAGVPYEVQHTTVHDDGSVKTVYKDGSVEPVD